MADKVDIDLFADNLKQDFAQEFSNESVDLYDDVVADGNSSNGNDNPAPGLGTNSVSSEPPPNHTPNAADGPLSNIPLKRFQLYVGNLTWWTSDQDITDAVHDIGVNDFLDVKFFEDRANGQSKGFCVISLASESIMQLCMDKLPKIKLNGQCPVVTYPTMEALYQFEAQSKTRAAPPPQSNLNKPQQTLLPPQINNAPRFMMPPQQQQQQLPLRGRLPAPGMLGGQPMQLGRVPGLPHQIVPGIPPNAMRYHQPLPGFPQGLKPRMMPQTMPSQNRLLPPGMYQGPPPNQGMPRPPHQGGLPQAIHNDPRFLRTDWNPPAGPPVQGMPPNAQRPSLPQQLPLASHVNKAFLQQSQHQNWHQVGQGYGSHSSSGPRGGADEHRKDHGPAIDKEEFDEIMCRNRTVSSSAITRAVADAASGEYASAVETLVTAISLIKLSKVSGDDRCKILINSLEVTLHGIETKTYRHDHRDRSCSRGRERSCSRGRERSRFRGREKSRSRGREKSCSRGRERSHSHGQERYHKRSRRDRSQSREHGERSRENDRDREKESRYYDDRHREKNREGCRVVRERERDRHEQRGESSHRTSRH